MAIVARAGARRRAGDLRRRAALPPHSAEATARAGEDADRADLEARKESLYRQIRDAELDREQGKLSQADWARVDAELRRDAIAVLKQIDAARRRSTLD